MNMADKDLLNYKGYYGSALVSIEDGVIHGKIECISDLVTYESESVAGIKSAFEFAVDDYLATCAEIGKEPDKTMSGTLNVRIGQELHKKAHLRAVREDISLNELIKKAVAEYVNETKAVHMHVHLPEHNREERELVPIDYNDSFMMSDRPHMSNIVELHTKRIVN
jgi:predicted HicB family RNase H-like nuclease